MSNTPLWRYVLTLGRSVAKGFRGKHPLSWKLTIIPNLTMYWIYFAWHVQWHRLRRFIISFIELPPIPIILYYVAKYLYRQQVQLLNSALSLEQRLNISWVHGGVSLDSGTKWENLQNLTTNCRVGCMVGWLGGGILNDTHVFFWMFNFFSFACSFFFYTPAYSERE